MKNHQKFIYQSILIKYLFFAVFFSTKIHAQVDNKRSILSQLFVPIKGDYLYIERTEVSNGDYGEFIYWLRQNQPAQVSRYYPDTLVWLNKLAYQQPFMHYYFTHPAYRNYPLVGITQSQAAAYCQWKHNQLKEAFILLKYNIDSFIVRLPTKDEWEHAARGGLDKSAIYPWPGDKVRMPSSKSKDAGKALLNCRLSATDEPGSTFTTSGGFITAYVSSYWPNGYGLYNMCGNVAEWVQDKGISKGGSYADYPSGCTIPGNKENYSYDSANCFTGFRCVVELVSVKDKKKEEQKLDEKYLLKGYVNYARGKYIAEAEVSNAGYQLFLKNSGLTQFAPQDSLWAAHTPYQYMQNYSKAPSMANHPVVNISYEGAVAYCAWLTETYNNLPERRYKKVSFRLPSLIEWDSLSRGGRVGNSYPWGGPYTRNSKGCYLANFKPMNETYLVRDTTRLGEHFVAYDTAAYMQSDGGLFTVEVYSYFPNDYGLYNCSGNAAEMVYEKGIRCGGSWNSVAYYIRNGVTQTYTKPSPELGFRVFMEVLEQ